jgi:hypothetical protein
VLENQAGPQGPGLPGGARARAAREALVGQDHRDGAELKLSVQVNLQGAQNVFSLSQRQFRAGVFGIGLTPGGVDGVVMVHGDGVARVGLDSAALCARCGILTDAGLTIPGYPFTSWSDRAQ